MKIYGEQINDYMYIMIRNKIRDKIREQTSNQVFSKTYDEVIVPIDNSQVRRQVYHQVKQNVKL
jgi:hypothetical protein